MPDDKSQRDRERDRTLKDLEGKTKNVEGKDFETKQAKAGMIKVDKTTANQQSSSGKAAQDKRAK